MPRIDLHVHVSPAAYRDQLPSTEPARRSVSDLLAYMDTWPTDGAIVSAGGPLKGDRAAPDLATLINEGYAEMVADQSDRLGALASVALPDVDAALENLRYALDTLALDGVFLCTNYDGIYLGDARLDAFFDELQHRGAYCFVHPTFPPHASLPGHPGRWYEFPFDTTRAFINLAVTGTFDRCPDVRFQWAHLGGTLPFLTPRMASLSRRGGQEAAPSMQASIREYVARQYFDTAASAFFGNLLCAQAIAPHAHVVFGTDWPYVDLPDAGDDPQPELAFLGIDRARVDSENARALVPVAAARILGPADDRQPPAASIA